MVLLHLLQIFHRPLDFLRKATICPKKKLGTKRVALPIMTVVLLNRYLDLCFQGFGRQRRVFKLST